MVSEWRAARRARVTVTERAAAPGAGSARDVTTIDDYALTVSQLYMDAAAGWGIGPGAAQWAHEPAERVVSSFEGYARQLYEGDGVVGAISGVRCLAFSLVRFQWQRMRGSRGTTLFGMPNLTLLERPSPGTSTQGWLWRVMQDVDLAGNSYTTTIPGPEGPELLRLRPDWVQILLAPVETDYGALLGWRKVGYTYHDGGIEHCPPERVALLGLNEVAHYAPETDPEANYRGMSWMTAVMREIVNDKSMERHKTKFFENAATPNISVALSDQVSPEQFASFKEKMNLEHRGVHNAYKTLYLGGGADVKVIGANLQQIDFSEIQGRGETRMAAKAGVPPVIVGLSEGLKQATYSNYAQAMRRFADLTMAGLWADMCTTAETLVPRPGPDTRLWYDTRDIAFLREEAKARAEVQQMRATTINVYITAGFTAESAVAAAVAEDETLLVHSGMVSVQLQPPGAGTTGAKAEAGTSGDGGADEDAPDPATNGGATNTGAPPPAVRGPAAPPPPTPALPDHVDRTLALLTNGHGVSTNGKEPR